MGTPKRQGADREREAILIVGITPPHYRKGKARWELIPYDSGTLSRFARGVGASIRSRNDYTWITTTFDVAAGTRTSSDPKRPGAAEALPEKNWERLRALFRRPDPNDFRLLSQSQKAQAIDQRYSATVSKPGGGSLLTLLPTSAHTDPPQVLHFPGIHKIEELRKRDLEGWAEWAAYQPLTLNEYLAFFHDKDGHYSDAKWKVRTQRGRPGLAGVLTYFPDELDSPARMVSIKAVLDYAIAGRDRRRCPIGEIHFITLANASGPVLLGTADVILLAKEFKAFDAIRHTTQRSILDLDGRVPIVGASGFESRASDLSTSTTNLRDLRAALAEKVIITFWNSTAIPALERGSVRVAFRDTYVKAFEQSYAAALGNLWRDEVVRAPIQLFGARSSRSVPVIARCLGIEGYGDSLIADATRETQVIELCRTAAARVTNLDGGVGSRVPLPSNGRGYGRMVGTGRGTQDLLGNRYPISTIDTDRVAALQDDAERKRLIPGIIKAISTLADDIQLLRALAWLDTVALLDGAVEYVTNVQPNDRIRDAARRAQNTLLMFVPGSTNFTITPEPHKEDSKQRWRFARQFTSYKDLTDGVDAFINEKATQSGATRGPLGALGILAHGAGTGGGVLVNVTAKKMARDPLQVEHVLDESLLLRSGASLKGQVVPGGDVVVFGCSYAAGRAGTSAMKVMARCWPDCWIVGFSVMTVRDESAGGLPYFFCTNSELEDYANPNPTDRSGSGPDKVSKEEARKRWFQTPADEFAPYAKIVWSDSKIATEPQVAHWPLLSDEAAESRPGDWFERPELDGAP